MYEVCMAFDMVSIPSSNDALHEVHAKYKWNLQNMEAFYTIPCYTHVDELPSTSTMCDAKRYHIEIGPCMYINIFHEMHCIACVSWKIFTFITLIYDCGQG